jgi:hypothetical protein
MYWDLLLACRVVELPIDISVLWLWVAPVGCSGNSKHIVMYSIKLLKLRDYMLNIVSDGLQIEGY